MKVYAAYPYSNLKVSELGGADLIATAGTDSPARTYGLTGVSDGSEEAIVATYQDSSRTKYAGGLWTATYKNEPFKLYLVPMPGITISDVDRGTLQQNLNNKIFSQAVITWTVGALPGFTSVDLGTNGLDWADNAMLSSYNTEMNSVISAFKEFKADADPEAYYLFIVPGFSEAGVEGFMPRNRRFGFVTLAQLKDRTVAHELGHGAFNLRHTFPEVPQGATDNLMDYAEGVNLYKPQWDLIHNPEFTTGLWDDMEDGAMINNDELISILENIRCVKSGGFDYFNLTSTNISKYSAINLTLSNNHTFSRIEIYRLNQAFQVTKNSILQAKTSKIHSSDGTNTTYSFLGNSIELFSIRINSVDENVFEEYVFPEISSSTRLPYVTAQTVDLIGAIDKGENVLGLLRKASLCVLSELTNEQRVKAIDFLCKNQVDAEDGELILKLLETYKHDNKNILDLLQLLRQNNRMDKLTAKIDNWFEKDNYTKFVGKLYGLFVDAKKDELLNYTNDESIAKLAQENRYFVWRKNSTSDESNPRISSIWYSYYYESNFIIFKHGLGTWIDQFDVDRRVRKRPPLDPFETIVVRFDTDPSFMEFKGDNRQLPMPAFVFAWLINEQTNKTTGAVADVMVNSIALCSGVGTILKGVQAANWLSKVQLGIRVYQAALNVGDIAFAISPELETNIRSLPLGDKFMQTYSGLSQFDSYSGSTLDLIFDGKIDQVTLMEAFWQTAKDSEYIKTQLNLPGMNEVKQINELINTMEAATYEIAK